MAITFLEILDTSVKIGLGALLTGVVTYISAQANHKREVSKEWRKKKRESLETIAQQTEEFSHTVLKYWALITEWGNHQNKGQEMPEDRLAKLRMINDELFHAYKNLSVVEARLLLLGSIDAQKICREYGELITRFTKTAWIGGPPLTKETSEKWRMEILGCRERFFRCLSSHYVGSDD